MDKHERYKALLKKKAWAQEKLERARLGLGHPHLDMMSAHDLAESDFKMWTAYLEDIEKELREIERELKGK